jgi:hypothetical protein
MTFAMKLRCPICRAPLEGSAVNVARDVAFCEACQQAWSCADLLRRDEADQVNLLDPPSGVSFERTPNGFTLSATTRSGMAFFMVPFMTVWSAGSLGTIYGAQIVKGQFELGPSLFGIPFLIGAILFWATTLMAVIGSVRVRVEGDRGEIFVGVGGLGRRRKFDWSRARRTGSAQANVRYPGGRSQQVQLVLADGRDICFGSGLSPERRLFVERALEKLRLERDHPQQLEPGTLSLPSEAEGDGHLSISAERGALSKDLS